MTPEEIAAIDITPENLRRVANSPCYGIRTIILRRAANEIERLIGELGGPMPQCDVPDCTHPATASCPRCAAMFCNDDSPGPGGKCPQCGTEMEAL